MSLNLTLPEGLEEMLRSVAAKKFGAKKGFLAKAAKEAFEEWIARNG